MKLDGMAALVTGAASGLGQATAVALAARGLSVVGVDLPDALERSKGSEEGIVYSAGDVGNENDIRSAIGAFPVDLPLRLVVNCAGVAPARRILSSRGPHDLETFRRTIEVNLVGTFNVLRLTAEAMARCEPDEQGQRGLIVNTASVAAYEGQIGQIAYAASKGGVLAMTLTAARDLARDGIRVNTIAPGVVNTPMFSGLGEDVVASLSAAVPFPSRLARPDEYAQLVIMLAEHDYLNGETIRMDGAIRMGPR